MAEFSKQWCEIHDSTGIGSDFDIHEIADGLPNEHYTSIICEGFGFVAVAKDINGNILLAFPVEPEEGEDPLEEGMTQVLWKSYEEVVK